MTSLYEILNEPRDSLEPERLHVSMYGDYAVEARDDRWKASYRRVGVDWNPEHRNGRPSSKFHMAYDVLAPSNAKEGIATIVLTNGVPVNRTEWLPVARLLARFFRVVVVDLFGMGDSSKPLEFKDRDGKWAWSWALHARIFKEMFDDWRGDHPEWFIDDKLFFGANDWGAGVVQVFTALYGSKYLLGALPCSAIALNGYWVQQIGSFLALASLPYKTASTATGISIDPMFRVMSIMAIGLLTTTLETMFEQVSDNHNQYTLALIQNTWVDTTAYSNPKKNPSNTRYDFHAIRVLAEQASHILGNGELLPYHETQNRDGLRFLDWDVPVKMLWGKQDKMMPEGQVHRFANIVAFINEQRARNNVPSNLSFSYNVIQGAGHFMVSDKPEETAGYVVDWMRTVVGPSRLNKVFLGFDSLARQDEWNHVIPGFEGLEAFEVR